MNKLSIECFKAFSSKVDVDLDGRSVLIYGENGAGKSSIFEALKVVFFKDMIESAIPSVATPEEQNQINIDFWDKYNNRSGASQFKIYVNGSSLDSFSKSSYQVFMLSIDDLISRNSIKYNDFLASCCIDLMEDTNDFCSENFEYITEEINDKIEKDFFEDVNIDIDAQDDFFIKITDLKRNIVSKSELKKFFNEAKLNLVLLLLFFETIRYAADNEKRKILILDDFITSLDVSNRTQLMNYIFKHFKGFQIIILTHNISFFNLVLYFLNEVYPVRDKWGILNLYEYNGENKVLINNAKSVADLRNLYADNLNQLELMGNNIRQKFEVLLYQFSKLLMIGAVEDSSKILSRIETGKNLYFFNRKNSDDLVDEIENILNQDMPKSLVYRLKRAINNYKRTDYDNLKKILRELKLYRKVTMHPLSHGTTGMSVFTKKEIDLSLDILEKLEKYIEGLKSSNVAGM